MTQAGEPYIRVVGTKTGFNHWDLRARVAQGPQALTDGVRLRLDILNRSQDLDQVLDGGTLDPRAARIVCRCAAWTEISPSGRGLHIFARGRVAQAMKGPGLEVYGTDRYRAP